MAHTVVLTDIPEGNVEQVLADFVADGATASKTKQPDGRYTVTATYPDPAGATAGVDKDYAALQHAHLQWTGTGSEEE